MTPHAKITTWLRPTLTSLALVCAASLSQAQNTNPTNTFDTTSSVASFVVWWGPPSPTMTWDGTLDAGNDPNSGSVRYDEPFVGAAGEQFMTFFTIANRWGWDGGYVLDATTYTNLSFDIRVDPSSGQRKANNDYGNLEIGLVTSGWATTALPGRAIPLSAKGNWVHFDYPLNPALANIDKVVGFFIKMWSDGGLTNSLIFNVDNFMITKPTGPVIIPPPTMSMRKAGPVGVEITMTDDSAQWQRDAISTPGPGSNYIWTAQGAYPVSYSCTIGDFPPVNTHQGLEAHMYIANGDTAPAGAETGGSPDWGCPDILIFRVENNRNTIITTNADLTTTTNYTYDARAQIQWKTNYPNANATNVPVVVHAPGVLGTWTVTFSDATHGSLSGPGITTTNFTLPADAVANNFSPLTNFVQFGVFKNDGANDGHNNQAHGTFSHVQFTGAPANSFSDDFTGPTLTNKYVWRKTSATAVQQIPPGTAWMLGWTLPATGFNPEIAATLSGPWSPLSFNTTYQSGGSVHAILPQSSLLAAGSDYFRLIKRPFTKLQVLMPGETAAPFTPTGKTGTPTAQTAGIPFNITVNAVDDYWNLVKSTDEVAITCSDASASLPLNAAMLGGTVTFSVTFGSASAPGAWTVTATDVTDATKTPNTGSPTVSQ